MHRPLRIAAFSYGLPALGTKRGGIERAADLLADGLARRGHEVVVFTHDARPERAAYDVHPLPWKPFVDTWIGRRLTMGYLGNVLALMPDYRRFDVVVAHGDSLLLPLVRKPIVRILYGSALGEAWSTRSPGRAALQLGVYVQELLTALLQDGVVTISESSRRQNPFVRRVIALAADDRVFAPDPPERTAQPSVLFVGTLAGRKRGSLLLRAFADEVRSRHPDATLTIVGEEGPPLPGVTYRIGIDDRELAALYRRAWIYATPSRYEGFGLPYLEALACGTPVVATRNPGSVEMLADGRYGVLAADHEFGHAVSTLLADADARAALRERGLQRAREYSLQQMLDRYEALLYEVVGEKAA